MGGGGGKPKVSSSLNHGLLQHYFAAFEKANQDTCLSGDTHGNRGNLCVCQFTDLPSGRTPMGQNPHSPHDVCEYDRHFCLELKNYRITQGPGEEADAGSFHLPREFTADFSGDTPKVLRQIKLFATDPLPGSCAECLPFKRRGGSIRPLSMEVLCQYKAGVCSLPEYM